MSKKSINSIAFIALLLVVSGCRSKDFNEDSIKEFENLYNESWELAGVEPEVLSIKTSFGVARVNAFGDPKNPVLILMPGMQSSSIVYAPNVKDLIKDFRLYLPDTIGDFGFSKADKTIIKPEEYASWLDQIVDSLNLNEAFYLGGYSFGGWQAANYTNLKPDKVKKLVLITPAGTISKMTGKFVFLGMKQYYFPSRESIVELNRLTRRVGSYDGEYKKWSEHFIEFNVVGYNSMRPEVMGRPRVFSEEELKSIKVPKLFIVGDEEVMYKNLDDAIYRARSTGFKVKIIKNANHDVNIANVYDFNKSIKDFLLN